MSNQLLSAANSAIAQAERKFVDMAKRTGMDYAAESLFAFQACEKNSYLARVAANNPISMRMSLVNVAAVGLSLNPATSLAYLVPRDGQVILDISYQGLIKIATDIGSILWAKAELVYDSDEFEYRGVSREPVHRFNPFKKDRGEFVGVYCIAKTPDGDYLVETMTASEIYQIRDLSMAYTRGGEGKKGPWEDFFGEMTKKSVIKRASKTWPKSARDDRLQTAVKVLNEHEGLRPEYLQGQQSREPEVIDSYDPSQISPAVREQVEKVVGRAKASNSWAAAKDYIQDRFRGVDLAYALDQLSGAQQAA